MGTPPVNEKNEPKQAPTAFVFVDYEEFSPETYKGFVLQVGEGDDFRIEIRVKSKNPLADRNWMKAHINELKDRGEISEAYWSSTVGNFMSDAMMSAVGTLKK